MMNSPKNSSLSAALNILSRRQMSEGMLRRRLQDKGYQSEEIESTVNRLQEWKYLDDRSFALSFINSRKAKMSPQKIIFELVKAGIDKQMAKELIKECYDSDMEHKNCLCLAHKLWNEESEKWERKYRHNPMYHNISPELFIRRRVGDKLFLRGYEISTVFSVLEQLSGDENSLKD